MKPLKLIIGICVSLLFVITSYSQEDKDIFSWSNDYELPNAKGVNGAFTGIHNDALIIAGGANFPNTPVWEGGKKIWHDAIYVLEKNGNSFQWIQNKDLKLTQSLAYGVSISTPKGLLCIGGDNENDVYKDVFLLKWNAKSKTIEREDLPPMPIALSGMGGSIIGDMVFLVGGQEAKGGAATSNFLSFNLTETLNRKQYTWKQLPDFPGESRLQAVVVGQGNGRNYESLYVFSGMAYNPVSKVTHKMLSDVYEYDTNKDSWIQKKSVPNNGTPGIEGGYIAAAPVIKMGASHIVIYGGAGGEHPLP